MVSAFGTSHAAFRDGLLEGRSGIAPLSGFETSDCRTTLAAQVTGFEPAKWVAPMKLRRLDRTGVYALALAQLAIEDAQRTPTPDGDDRSGVVLGTWTAGGQSTQQYLDAFFRSGPASAPALLFDSTVANSAASLAGMEYKLRGPNVTVSHKEASGLGAIVCAAELLRADRACGLLAGGVDAVFETFFKAYDGFGVMSGDAAFSSRQSPFDCERAGFVLGEGAFGLWLEQSDDRTGGQGGGSPWRRRRRSGGAAQPVARQAGAAGAHDAVGARGRWAVAPGRRRRLRVGERDGWPRSDRGGSVVRSSSAVAVPSSRRSRERSANSARPAEPPVRPRSCADARDACRRLRAWRNRSRRPPR